VTNPVNRWKLPATILVGSIVFLGLVAAVVIAFTNRLVGTSSAANGPDVSRVNASTSAGATQFFADVSAGRQNRASLAVAATGQSASVVSSAKVRRLPTREEEMTMLDSTQSTYLARFRSEPVDPAWSAAKQTTVAGRFGSLKQKFGLTAKVDDVACRTSMCIMKLHWPNWQTANAERRKFASDLSASEGCGHFISLPPPSQPESTPFSGELILDCETERTGETPRIP
jgi:hypothetical protein